MNTIPCTECGKDVVATFFRLNNGLCAACSKKSTKDRELREHLAKPGCPQCDGKRYINFAWPAGTASVFPELSKYPNYLTKREDLRFGSLWECRICKHKWYLDGLQLTMHDIPKDRELDLQRWNQQALLLESGLQKVLGEIGATPPDIYGNGKDRIVVPCRVQTKQGTVFDPAIVCFQPIPPIEPWHTSIRFVDEISLIEKSEFTLSPEVRVATSEADEVRMGFAPTIIVAPDGTRFCLNWTTSFFVHPTVKANSVKVADSSMRYDSSIQMMSLSEADIPRFIGDWNGDLVSLRLKTNTPRQSSPFKLVSTGPISS